MDVEQKPTAEVWRERIVAQQASGEPIRAWCRANVCPEHAFYWWRYRLNLSPAAVRPRGRPRGMAPVEFAKVVVDGSMATSEPIRLSLGAGRELTLPASMPIEQIARLVRAIEATP